MAQDWKNLTGAQAFHLIERHSDGWDDIERMMGDFATVADRELYALALAEALNAAASKAHGVGDDGLYYQIKDLKK